MEKADELTRAEILKGSIVAPFQSAGVQLRARPELNTRVLVIDDDEMVREIIREILEEESGSGDRLSSVKDELFGLTVNTSKQPPKEPRGGLLECRFEVFACASGKDGFELLKKQNDLGLPFATVLVDIKMPGWNGIETVRKIREIDNTVTVNFVSAFSDFNLQSMCDAGGPDIGYFCKPFSADEMRQAVTRSVHAWNQMRALEDLMDFVAQLAAATNFAGFLSGFKACLESLNGVKEFVILQRTGSTSCALLADSLGIEKSAEYSKITAFVLAAKPPAAACDGYQIFGHRDSFLIFPSPAIVGIAAARCLSFRSLQKFFEACLCVMQRAL